MSKPKFAMYWAASCGGCEIAVLNIHEKILDVDANFEVVFWPVAMDAKYKDVEAMEDGSILLTLFNGGIRNDENEHIAHLLRRKSKILVAFGSCACEGCIPGLANFSPIKEIVDTAYSTISTDNPDNIRPVSSYAMPEGNITIPTLYPTLRTLDQVVDVDYYMPGCPPESPPDRGSDRPGDPGAAGQGGTASQGCHHRRRQLHGLRRMHSASAMSSTSLPSAASSSSHADPELCLLEQGIPCNGPATRSGCNARCPTAGAQCIGCYGPAEGVQDYGARLIAAFASVIDSEKPEEIDKILDGLVDPAGQFYRFNLAGSMLHASKYCENQR